jgi:dihydroorotase-like cyclic amidohydrolase
MIMLQKAIWLNGTAVKTANDRKVLWEALLDDRIDVIATDHAPHTLEEKTILFKAPSRSISAARCCGNVWSASSRKN